PRFPGFHHGTGRAHALPSTMNGRVGILRQTARNRVKHLSRCGLGDLQMSGKIWVGLALVVVASACTKSTLNMPAGGHVPSTPGTPVDLGKNTASVVRLPNGADIVVRDVNGKQMFEVEGAFAGDYFASLHRTVSTWPAAERAAALNKEVAKVYSDLSAQKV